MKKLFFYILVLTTVFSCTEPIVSTFGSIGGTVQDETTGAFLSGVTVTINPLGYSQITNADGAFQYDNLDVAEYTIVCSKTGYESAKNKVTVKPGLVSSLQISLKPATSSIVVDPTILDFGAKTTELQLKLTSVSGSVPYTLDVSNNWITLSKTSGTVSGDDYVTVIVSRSGLSPATYDGNVVVTTGSKVVSVPVKMTVAESGVPVVTMESVTDISANSAVANGNIKIVGDAAISRYGFCWSSSNPSPTLSDQNSNLGDASDVKSFNGVLTGLTSGTKYYVRSYAINTFGTSYSDEVLSFTTAVSSADDGGNDSDSGSLAVPQGLASYYTFDDGDANDSTDNELDGLLINNPSFVDKTPNGVGKALSLNGVKEQYMSIPYNVFNNLTKLSVSFWIKDFNMGVVFSAISPDYVRSDHPRLIADTSNKFRFYTGYDNYDQTSSFAYIYTPIQSETWSHIAVTMNDDTRVLYVNGVRVDTNQASSHKSGHASTKVNIGGDNEGKYNAGYMTMKIDNIRFYQRCLSDAEIKEIYNSEK